MAGRDCECWGAAGSGRKQLGEEGRGETASDGERL